MVTKLDAFLAFVVVTVPAFVRGQNEYCYEQDSNPYGFFGDKTPYKYARSGEIYSPAGCKVLYIWALMRHGTRYMDQSDKVDSQKLFDIRDQIIANHDLHKRGKLCSQDLNLLRNWKPSEYDQTYGQLASQGRTDMESLAERLRKLFSNYLAGAKKDKFSVQTNAKGRCQDSAIVFMNKMLGTTFTDITGNNIKINNEMLRIGGYKKPSEIEELVKFKKSTTFSNLLAQITERLGYESTLNFETVMMMYKRCVFDKALLLDSKPAFCALFSMDGMKIMEYYKDIETYYSLGHGELTMADQACPVVNDLYKNLESASENANPSTIASFLFSQSRNILTVLTKLGLFRDSEAPKYDNFEKVTSRLWRTSLIDPFAANVIVVFFNCSNWLQVAFYSNEMMVKLPGCDNSFCEWKTVKEKFTKEILSKCPQIGPSSGSGASGLETMEVPILLCIFLFLGYFFTK